MYPATLRAAAALGLFAGGLVGGSGPARAGEEPALPETPAGKQLAAWLRAYNSGEVDVVRRFVTDRYARSALGQKDAVARRLEVFNRVYAANGPLEVVRVEKSADRELTALTRSRAADSWLRLTAFVEADPPHAITRVGIEFTDGPPEPGRGKLGDAQIVKELEAFLDKLAGAGLFSGTVLLARDGKPLVRRAYGLASRAYQVPNRVDTKFNLGSMNKMFTAVAVAQLAQQGRLDFNDPLGKHLPDYPNKEAARKVTLHHLLTHTSGIGDYFTDKYMETSKDRFRKIQDYLPLFVNEPLAFEPGKEFRYSNGGFMVLGAVVEKVSGQDYFDYVREHVYRPAGMVNTDAYEMDHDTPNLAIGYTAEVGATGRLGAATKNNLFLHVVKGGPAGGGFSTVEDLLRFDTALRGGKLLDRKLTDLVLAGKVAAGRLAGSARYAYGFFDDTYRGTRIVGHGGGFPGINAALDMYLDKGYTVAVLSNLDPPAAHLVADKLKRLITQE
jgi:CubicO group peptidase (beta-lactamase class C family)